MASSKSSLQSPLGKAKGHGAGKEGVHHWWHQKLTAVALIPLTIWFITLVVKAVQSDYSGFIALISEPINSITMILFIVFSFYHAVLGMQVVIEDYITCPVAKYCSLIAVKLGGFVLGVAAVFSVCKIAFIA